MSEPTGKIRPRFDGDSWRYLTMRQSTEGMTFPYECTRCGCVHDVAKVTPVGRYLDCTTWKCPGCGSLIDDRPIGWGGSARKL